MKGPSVAWDLGKPSLSGRPPTHSISRRSNQVLFFCSSFLSRGFTGRPLLAGAVVVTQGARDRGKPLETRNSQVATSDKGKRSPGHSKTSTQVMQTMLSHLVVISLTIMATSASVVMTRVERVCPGSNQCLPFSSCTMLQGRNKQDTLQAIRYCNYPQVIG